MGPGLQWLLQETGADGYLKPGCCSLGIPELSVDISKRPGPRRLRHNNGPCDIHHGLSIRSARQALRSGVSKAYCRHPIPLVCLILISGYLWTSHSRRAA
jgi:hypothetical protein